MTKHLKPLIKYLLFATAFTPLIIVETLPFPYVTGKTLFFRVLVDITLILFLVYLSWGRRDEGILVRLKQLFKHPLFIAILVFFGSALLSTVFAKYQFYAFWGDAERGDGLFNWLHFLVFLIVAATIFEKKDWLAFFKVSLGVGFLVMFYGWLQEFRVENFPFALPFAGYHGGSTLGNRAFWGTYILFLIGFGLLVFINSKRPLIYADQKSFDLAQGKLIDADRGVRIAANGKLMAADRFWRYFSVAVIVMSVPAIAITYVRGTMLGFVAGVLFFFLYFSFLKTRINPPKFSEEKLGRVNTDEKRIDTDADSSPFHKDERRVAADRKLKKWSRRALVILVALGLLFIVTKNATIWKSVPGFDRLATISLDDPSLQTRKIALGVGWKAFKEEPILGWGLDNYITAYNRHYNPAYSTYEEAHFDRAHSKPFGVLVMQGILGFVSYLAIFAFFFYILFRKVQSGWPRAILGGMMTAYFVQNLVLFDTPTSHWALFSVFGFLISISSNEASNGGVVRANKRNLMKGGFKIIAVIVAAVGLYVIYAYNYVPYVQARTYLNALKSTEGSAIVEIAPDFLEPYNFIQSSIRFQFLQVVVDKGVTRREDFRPLTELAVKSLQEVVDRNLGYDIRDIHLIAEAYNDMGTFDSEALTEAERLLRYAVQVSPTHQDNYYLLAFNLASQGRFDEAIELNRYAIFLNKKVARSHYNLGISLTLAGKSYWDEAASQFRRALDIGFINPAFLKTDFNNISVALENMLSEYILNRDKERTVEIARMLKEVLPWSKPELVRDMDVIIDYAEREDWDTLIEAIMANSPDTN